MDTLMLYDMEERLLPPSLREIREVIGVAATLRMVEGCGGIRVFIPKRPRPEHRLQRILGEEAFRLLSARYGGETLSVPRADRIVRRLRNLTIAAAYDTGMPVRELARRHQLTERQVYAILANH